MAKIWYDPVIRVIRGKIGKLVYRLMPDGSSCVSTGYDFSQRTFSQGQKDHQSRFQQASRYARAAQSQPIYTRLAAGSKLTPYNVAVSDWFHAPVIEEVRREKGCIRVRATDNVRVARVLVTILDENGVIREKGEGVRGEEDWWEYATETDGRVRLEAWDLAGNVTSVNMESGSLLPLGRQQAG